MNYWEERVREEIARAEKLLAQAKRRIPGEYHDFLVLLKQNMKLGKPQGFSLSENMRQLGAWMNSAGELYVPVQLPYCTVDGRVAMARDEHKKEGKKLHIYPTEFDIQNKLCRVKVESEIYGVSCGTVTIGFERGVDRTNPYENAETSALGRALGFMGYGIVGTGIASADEVLGAQETPTAVQAIPEPNGRQTNTNKEESKEPVRIRGSVTNVKAGPIGDKRAYSVQLNTGHKILIPEEHPDAELIQRSANTGEILEFHARPWQEGFYAILTTKGSIREVIAS